MWTGLGYVVFASVIVGGYLVWRKIAKMAKAGSPFFKIGYALYTKTRIGYMYYRREVEKARQRFHNEGHSIVEPTIFEGLKVCPVSMSLDNYSYVVVDTRSHTAVLVDPADPDPVQSVIDKEAVTPVAVLTTHKHWDHSAGNREWKNRYDNIRIYGGALDNVPAATHSLSDGEQLEFGALQFTVHYTPGHTVGHCIYLLNGTPFGAPPCLFSGDHLFLAGMGRMFECSPGAMLSSLDKILTLPDNTLIWPGHEYAMDNLEFAAFLDPDNQSVIDKFHWAQEKRKQKLCTAPSCIEEEKKYNPFLRTGADSMLRTLGITKEADESFDSLRARALAEIRTRKDKYKYKL